MLKGKKTYVIVVLMLAFNALGVVLNTQDPTHAAGLDANTAIQGILTALGLAGLRAGIGTK